jgi:glutamate synthase (NADPH) large chain
MPSEHLSGWRRDAGSFVAEELRLIMAEMGFRTVEEMVGRVDRINMRKAIDHWKAQGIDLSKLLHVVDRKGTPLHQTGTQDHGLEKALDQELIAASKPALEKGEAVRLEREVKNVNRTVGAMLSGEVAKKYGHDGLPDNTIKIAFTGVAGQSFGAFLAHGITLELTGDANDYVGKGLSGGRVIVKQPGHVKRDPLSNIIVGNTVLYGAIAGEAYFNGVAGERFAVRNSGAVAVVEGTGDHGCEYMTGGVVVVLGKTGRNFAAGMSGGVAYVYDEDGLFRERCNMAMVDIEPILPDPDADAGTGRPQQRAVSVHDYGMGDMLYHSAERLRIMLERHHLHTGSKRARAILDDWPAGLNKFLKVMPRDYARALKQLEAERLEAASVAAE